MSSPVAKIQVPAPARQARSQTAEWHVERLHDLTQLRRLLPQWQELAARAAEPNVFYEPWMLLPAIELFHPRLRLEVYAVHRRTRTTRQLVGLIPFERGRRFGPVPIPHRRLLRYYFCALCTPLLDREHGEGAARQLVRTLRRERGVVDFELVAGDGPVAGWLRSALGEYDLLIERASDRALYLPAATAEDYLRATLRPDKRRDLRRLERRLAEHGAVEFASLRPDEPPDDWTEAFLRLEASGWKGRGNSALAASEQSARYFRRICRSAHRLDRLELHALRVGGRDVAQICLLAGGGGLFALRTAYDEDYARYSPGMLLSVWHTCALHERRHVLWIDSCSAPDNRLVNQIWKGRRPLLHLRVADGLSASMLRCGNATAALLRRARA